LFYLQNCVGWGKFVSSSSGQTYEGYWKDGVKVSGQFILYKVVIAQILCRRQDGPGTMFLAHGDSFSGKWKDGLLDGPVAFKFGEGSLWNDGDY
jgi:hypothetical protein